MHEPFAPSTSNAALRHSRALNVGSFHSPTERLLSTLVARRFVESFFGRLDARTASSPATAELMARQFPGDYRLVPDSATAPPSGAGAIYRELAARRHDPDGDPALRERLAGRPLIDVDLHMHTDHSYDCATPVEVLLATARERGLGAIAVTDHNEISGALAAREHAREAGVGVKVIVGEEVKTADQGEVIGLFIEEKIPRGMTPAGDRRGDPPPGRAGVRAAPVRPHALGPRLRAPADDRRRRRRDRGVQPARGDRRVQRGGRALRRQVPDRRGRGLGLARRPGTRLGAQSACASSTARPSSCSRCATPRSITRPTSLLYVQALKFLQTRATPPSARRASRAQAGGERHEAVLRAAPRRLARAIGRSRSPADAQRRCSAKDKYRRRQNPRGRCP